MFRFKILNPMKLTLKAFGTIFVFTLLTLSTFQLSAQATNLREKQYQKADKENALQWQNELRAQLFDLLKMRDLVESDHKIDFNATQFNSEKKEGYTLKEIEINSTKSRRIKIILTIPDSDKNKFPAVICITGHGGDRYTVYNNEKIYKNFAAELAKKEYITISTNVGQHEVFESNRTLMGERLWDLMRCADYLESLPMVDKGRMGCAGLSLGGEMVMWLGAMDTRMKVNVSAGFLTNMDQMEQNHCMCWKFEGLRELVDFSDIYSMIAPRHLQCQNGMQEPLTAFTPELAKKALQEIKPIYKNFDKPNNVELIIHDGAHEIDLPTLLSFFESNL